MGYHGYVPDKVTDGIDDVKDELNEGKDNVNDALDDGKDKLFGRNQELSPVRSLNQ